MSLISSFVTNQLLKALENEFVNHEQEIQDAIIAELALVADNVKNWVEQKLQHKAAQAAQPEQK